MKILISNLSKGVGHQILDGWHAYQQHLQRDNNYVLDTNYQLADNTSEFNKTDYNISILLCYFKQAKQIDQKLLNQFDLILICNGGEPLSVGHPEVKELVENNCHVYVIANSLLTPDHKMYDKTIWFPSDVLNCQTYWTKYFYPQYFDLYYLDKLQQDKMFYFINGENRANRQFFMNICNELNLNLPTKNVWSKTVVEVADSQWESTQDTEFKNFVNGLYTVVLIENSNNIYYNSSINVGIDNAFGKIAPGYFPLPLYFETYCVIFPESGWQNNELNITEKSLKCFYAGSLPFPIAGANVNQLYNQVGFYTAWNLLPKDMQKFDTILDHVTRYREIAKSIQWLKNNPEVFTSSLFKEMTNSNKIKFLTCDCNYIAIDKFDQLLGKFLH